MHGIIATHVAVYTIARAIYNDSLESQIRELTAMLPFHCNGMA